MKINMGENIRRLRRSLDMTQEQLAEKLSVSVQSVSRWECGTTYPDMEMLPAIAGVFGVTVDTLFGCTDEEKKQYCDELYSQLEQAVNGDKEEEVVEILRKIRRDIAQYNNYWFYGLYHMMWGRRFDRNEGIMTELRALSDAILNYCPDSGAHGVIEWMSTLENEEDVHKFLDIHVPEDDTSRTKLLLHRYRNRGDDERHEPLRKFHLWMSVCELIDVPKNWQHLDLGDHARTLWECRTNLSYLHGICSRKPDPKFPLTGDGTVDLWCETRLSIGRRMIAALAALGETEEAFEVLEDFVSLLENIMDIREDEFRLSCTSPALDDFYMEASFHWMDHSDGAEYRELCYHAEGWCCWIIPSNYAEVFETQFSPLSGDSRYGEYLERIRACVITR